VDKRSFERESGGGNVVPGAPLFFASRAIKSSLNKLRVALPGST
jgi:hypothetical protein